MTDIKSLITEEEIEKPKRIFRTRDLISLKLSSKNDPKKINIIDVDSDEPQMPKRVFRTRDLLNQKINNKSEEFEFSSNEFDNKMTNQNINTFVENVDDLDDLITNELDPNYISLERKLKLRQKIFEQTRITQKDIIYAKNSIFEDLRNSGIKLVTDSTPEEVKKQSKLYADKFATNRFFRKKEEDKLREISEVNI